MKIFAIIMTVVAIVGVGLAGYLYWQSNDMRKDFSVCEDQREGLTKDNAQLEERLTKADSQLTKIDHVVIALQTSLNSFMFAGDTKVLTVDLKEAVVVEEALADIDDSQDRMMAEESWKEFKTNYYFNPLFGLLRGLADSQERILAQPK